MASGGVPSLKVGNMRKLKLGRWLAGGVLVLAATAAMAQGSKAFPSQLQMGNEMLVLNGKGTRMRAVFQVYELALYLQKKTQDPQQVMNMPGAKSARFVALRDIPSDQFGLSLIGGMRKNLSADQATEIIRYMDEVIKVFSTEPQISKGQTFSMDYIPGKGTAFYLDGVQKGPIVTYPGFAAAVLSIWMGDNSIDPQLKDGLLGYQPAAKPANVHMN